jgi:cell division protein FtsL
MNAVPRPTAPLPPTLTIRRPLVLPAGDPRLLLKLMRGLFVRRTLLLLGVLVGLGLVHVWLQLQVVDVAYQLSAARRMLKRLDHEQSELKAELASLRDPAKLAARARAELGMVDPQPWQIVELR